MTSVTSTMSWSAKREGEREGARKKTVLYHSVKGVFSSMSGEGEDDDEVQFEGDEDGQGEGEGEGEERDSPKDDKMRLK